VPCLKRRRTIFLPRKFYICDQTQKRTNDTRGVRQQSKLLPRDLPTRQAVPMNDQQQEFRLASIALEEHGVDAMERQLTSSLPIDTSQLSEFLLWNVGSKSQLNWGSRLVLMGANINYLNCEGASVLSRCVHSWDIRGCLPTREAHNVRSRIYLNAIEFLSLGFDPNARYLGCSVTGLAVSLNCPELATLLVISGADLDREEEEGWAETLRTLITASSLDWPKKLIDLAEHSKFNKSRLS
jgi:hypothetical protein